MIEVFPDHTYLLFQCKLLSVECVIEVFPDHTYLLFQCKLL